MIRQATLGIRLIHRLRHDSRNERFTGMVMLAFAVVGLTAANLPGIASGYEALSTFTPPLPIASLTMPLSQWVEDGVLTLFFLVVGLDLRQEMATGFLSDPKKATVPVVAACGGVAVPALIFWTINSSSPELAHGWTVPTATDIAFSITVLTLVSRRGSGELRAFLMTLAVVDDIIGIGLIAIVYSHLTSPWPVFVLAACLLSWFLLIRMRRPIWPVVAAIGLIAWYAMLSAGIHPTLSGVAVGLLTPARPVFREMTSRAERYRGKLSPWSAMLALPVFAFFAMGIPLCGIGTHELGSTVFLGILIGLVIGKPLGIMLTARLCTAVGLSLGDGIRWRDLLGVAQLCGIGFTVSFLMADLAFSHSAQSSQYADTAKLAVLIGSLISCLLGVLIISANRHADKRHTRCV
ncbi:MAG: Na+/H+ antiporter NhaA [Bifidobacterium mongoliense]|uniref:Na+/H+ antiporter NhaA n=1 Tax=Bifidobacterium mongoliense TaxID=518643 RepID=UPI002F35C020